MNVRLITKTLHTLSLLSDEDYDLVLKLRALTEDERGLLMTVLEPQKPATKKTGKKPSKKSERASGMAAQLKERREQGREVVTTKDDDYGIVLCGASLASSGANCDLPEGHALHADKGYVDYHPFQPSVPTAPTRSPANGGAGSGTANLETQPEDVSAVHHAGG